jgi:hypothetical protein
LLENRICFDQYRRTAQVEAFHTYSDENRAF